MLKIKHLIASCQSGDQDAQKELYKYLFAYLQAVANRYLRDTSYLKDVLQESFIKIFRSLNQYDHERASIKQWSARITINVCLNYNRRIIEAPKDELIIDLHEIPVEPVILQHWTNEDLLYILKKMPPGNFEVFNLYVIDGYSHEEISKMLSISVPSSRKRLSRGKVWLRNYIQKKPNLIKAI